METVQDGGFKESAKKSAGDFTRCRKMPFEEVVLFMLMSFKCSTQSGLRRFFAMLGKPITMKQQSFSEARAKINVEAFVILFKVVANAMAERCFETWHGFLVYAIDGSKIALPSDLKLLLHFGTVGRGGTSPTAQGSIVYDVLNDIVLDAAIEPIATDERTLAKAHIAACVNIVPDSRKLFIFDRGYASFDLIETLEGHGFSYVMRVREKFNTAIDAQKSPDGYVTLEKGGKTICVRVVKFMLDSGGQEVLVTNITDKRLGEKAFKKLYFHRWPIETKYDIVKNKLQLENFTSRTVLGVGQDFFASMYLANIAAAAAKDAQAEIEKGRECKCNKYRYRANMNELIGVLKDRFILALTEDSDDKKMELINNIIGEIQQSVVPIRENRQIPRNPSPRKCKFHHNRKVNC
jgi:hypothetical protein